MGLVNKLPFVFIITIHFTSLVGSCFYPSTNESGHHHLIRSQPALQHLKRLTVRLESNYRSKQAEPLWPGARFTRFDRTRAINRGDEIHLPNVSRCT